MANAKPDIGPPKWVPRPMERAVDKRRIATIYREYVVAEGLERAPLLEGLAARVTGSPAVLYPGSFVHLTPSFFFQHVVYVDRSDFARDFFSSTRGVISLINDKKHYPEAPFFRFLSEDFTESLPLMEAGFDLMFALYTGGVSHACARYVKRGGWVLSNDHHGDALEAALRTDLALEAVVEERRGKARFIDGDLTGYLQPLPQRGSGRRRAPDRRYTRSADYYLFRKK